MSIFGRLFSVAPVCRRSGCERPCQYYGEVGGYSVQCREHNEDDAVKRFDLWKFFSDEHGLMDSDLDEIVREVEAIVGGDDAEKLRERLQSAEKRIAELTAGSDTLAEERAQLRNRVAELTTKLDRKREFESPLDEMARLREENDRLRVCVKELSDQLDALKGPWWHKAPREDPARQEAPETSGLTDDAKTPL